MNSNRIKQVVCVINYPQYMEIGEIADAIKNDLFSKYKINIDYAKPQQYGPVQVVNFAYKFELDGTTNTINMSPDGLVIIREMRDSQENFENVLANFNSYVYDIWKLFNDRAQMMIITRAGYVAEFISDSLEPDHKPKFEKHNGYFRGMRFFKFDTVDFHEKKISIVDNIFYDYENNTTTMQPDSGKTIIDISVMPNSKGITDVAKLTEFIDNLYKRVQACHREVFNV